MTTHHIQIFKKETKNKQHHQDIQPSHTNDGNNNPTFDIDETSLQYWPWASVVRYKRMNDNENNE